MNETQIAMQVQEVAKIISGAPFPSKQSLAKARKVVEYLVNRFSLPNPEGWVLMPRVLTEEMLQAGYPADDAQEGYEAMIAARPEVMSD